jgi:hypothetical protein
MNALKSACVVLLIAVTVCGSTLLASAQATASDPIGPAPLLPCTEWETDEPAPLLAEVEQFLARLWQNPAVDTHVAQIERCYPLYLEPEVWPMYA